MGSDLRLLWMLHESLSLVKLVLDPEDCEVVHLER